MNSTVAHELAHGIGVDHHGPPSDGNTITIYPDQTTYKIYAHDGVLITKRPYSIEGIIGSPGNDASGDLLCIMAYTNQYQWVFHEENLVIMPFHFYLRATTSAVLHQEPELMPMDILAMPGKVIVCHKLR